MLTNKQSLYLSGVVLIGFFVAGLFGVLDNLIVQIVFGGMFLLVIINLFTVKKEPEEFENSKNEELIK